MGGILQQAADIPPAERSGSGEDTERSDAPDPNPRSDAGAAYPARWVVISSRSPHSVTSPPSGIVGLNRIPMPLEKSTPTLLT